MNKPNQLSAACILSLKEFSEKHQLNIVEVLSPDFLKWDAVMGSYYFTYGNMYYGLETDGYLHT